MAYSYLIHFEIDHDKMTQLEIGSSLERALGYLRILLPSEDGFMQANAMRSLEDDGPIHLLFLSRWETWEDLKRHVDSNLAEEKILKEFEPHVKIEDLTTRIYDDVE